MPVHSSRYLIALRNAFVSIVLAVAAVSGRAAPPQSAPGGNAQLALKDYGLKAYIHVSRDLPHREDTNWKLVCALPHNSQFQPYIEVEAPAGKTLTFNSSNPLVLYLTPTETCGTRDGVHEYEAKNWISGEGAVYTIPAGVSVKAVKYRETGYDTTFAGSFTCNDDDYNILWLKAARTAYLCMRDHFYDCPDRERVGFWGDGTPELDQCFYIFDTNSHALCKNLVLRKLQPTFYPGQHLEFLGDYGLWFYYLQTGDRDSVAAVYDATKTFLLETYKFGNPNTWFDWGKDSKDTSIIETCFFYIDLGALRKLALVTGHEADLPRIDAKLHEIQASFDARFWKGGYYQSPNVTEPDDRANAMAVNAGLADPSHWEAIYANVLRHTTNSSCFFDRWIFEALCTMGKPDKALLRMSTRYRTMIDSSFTTLWEHYDRWWASRRNAFDDASSLNHGWNPPALVLSQDIAGIRPVEPGWATYQVLPKEAFLTSLQVVVPSIKGPIKVDIRKTANEYALALTSPADTQAIVGIPRASFKTLDSVTVAGRRVWDGVYRPGAPGVSWDGEEGGYLRFRVGPGVWHFLGHGALLVDSPKPPRPQARPETVLDKRGWAATASTPDGSFLFSGARIPIEVPAANAIDGDHWTGWRDMTRTQYPGQWFQVDMQQRQSFDKIVLDNTWAQWDSPNTYAVTVSDDGVTWSAPLAVGHGTPGITTVTFPLQTARWIRVTQTGTDPTYHWSIYEFDVCRTKRDRRSPGPR
jgi:alpha-L-rhamnosidase